MAALPTMWRCKSVASGAHLLPACRQMSQLGQLLVSDSLAVSVCWLQELYLGDVTALSARRPVSSV